MLRLGFRRISPKRNCKTAYFRCHKTNSKRPPHQSFVRMAFYQGRKSCGNRNRTVGLASALQTRRVMLFSSSKGFAPTSEELAQTSEELEPTSEEFAPTSEGLAPTSEELAQISE